MKIFKPFFLLPVLVIVCACAPTDEPLTEEQIERNNRGVALMGQYRNEEARQVFAELAAERPDLLDVQVNEAIAVLNRQEEGDETRALRMVREVLERDSGHVRAQYVAGLLHFYLGEAETALDYFSRVIEARPDDAHAAYFAAQAKAQLGHAEQAAELYRQAVSLDPYLRSAYYGAALVLRQLDRPEQAREKLEAYQRFENNPRAHLAEFRYTRMGRLAEAIPLGEPGDSPSLPDPEGELFDAPEAVAAVGLEPRGLSLTAVDLDGNGLLDLYVAGGSGQPGRILRQGPDGFEIDADHQLARIENVTAAGWGDMDNNGQIDVYLCRGSDNQLLAGGGGEWTPRPGSGDVDDAGMCADMAVFDADHDGDLDAFVVNADGPNELFNNNLDGSWRRLSEEVEIDIGGGNRASRSVLAVDLDGDRIADIVVLHDSPPHQVLRNDRLWQYRDAEGFDDFRRQDLVAVSAGDFNADGQVSLVSIDTQGRLLEWRPDTEGQWRARGLHEFDLASPDSAQLAVLDLDGDGRPEILVHHDEGFEVIAVSVDEGTARSLYSQSVDLAALTPLLLDPEQGPSLAGVVVEDGETRLVLWPPGEGRHSFAAIAPSGRTERAESMRSNASGIGTGIVVRTGTRWLIADTYDRHSAPGQSLQPLALGLGGDEQADFVRLFWTDGVLQTEMGLAAGEVHRITETQRQLASCPVLFAWDGERYDFVSDLLGVAGIGFFLEPGTYSDPRPWEFFKFPEGSIAPREGRYTIKIGEPMEEIAYIDTARLHVHDLPPGWGVTLDERMHTGGGPEPTGAAIYYREDSVRLPARAMNDRGEDVTETVRVANHEAAPPGERHRQFLGRLEQEHRLTLSFDEVINPPGSRPVLVAHGWVEYPYSQTLFSAWQAGADYTPPSLEAHADGQWQMVYEQFGYPAGMPREMSLPLDALPAGTTALRLSGNWEVYWDQIKVVHAESPPASAKVHELGIDRARVAKTGFARRDTLDQRLPYYDYEDRSPYWDTKYPTGYYTALGPVEPLVTEANDAFAVFGPGEELHLEFEMLEPPAEGIDRVVVLEVRGYAKDMDLYTRDGETVGPMPYTPGVGDPEARERLHSEYLTRFQGGF